jgi:Ser/Thr protein kinase RdoA (MazF antagonist)
MSGGAQWLPALAQTLLAADSVAAPNEIDEYEHWYAIDDGVPAWSRRAASWSRALDHLATADFPHAPSRFIHRDFHPANVLWSRGRITAVVDWVNGCRGPIEADIAITRVNLALVAGAASADAFLAACGSEIAAGYDPVWDLTVACSLNDPSSLLALAAFGARLTVESVCRTLDDVVERAVSNLR